MQSYLPKQIRRTHRDTQKAQDELDKYLIELTQIPEVPLQDKEKFRHLIDDALMTSGIYTTFHYNADDDGIFTISRNLQASLYLASEWSRQGRYMRIHNGSRSTIIDMRDLWEQLRLACIEIFPSAGVDALRKSREETYRTSSGSYTVGLDKQDE